MECLLMRAATFFPPFLNQRRSTGSDIFESPDGCCSPCLFGSLSHPSESFPLTRCVCESSCSLSDRFLFSPA